MVFQNAMEAFNRQFPSVANLWRLCSVDLETEERIRSR